MLCTKRDNKNKVEGWERSEEKGERGEERQRDRIKLYHKLEFYMQSKFDWVLRLGFKHWKFIELSKV